MSTVLNRVAVGEVGVVPGTVKMRSDKNLAAITTAGFINNLGNQLGSQPLAPSDVIQCLYSFNDVTLSGQFTILTVEIDGGVITLVPQSGDDFLQDGYIFVGNADNVATGVAMAGDASIDNTGSVTISNAAVTLAKLAPGVSPAGVIKYMGQLTTVGGAAAEAFTVTGAVGTTDRAFVQIVNDGTANVTVLQAVVTNNTLTVTFSGNPGNDTILNYILVRAAS